MTEPTSTSVRAPAFALGDGAAAYDAVVEQARADEWATRLFDRDATLWTDDPDGPEVDRRAPRLARRAGGLRRPRRRPSRASATASSQAGFTTAVVAGMGGSSLAPDVLHRTFGTPGGLPRPAHPRFDRSRRRSAAVFDDLDPLETLCHRRQQVRHDDRAATRSSPTSGTSPTRRSTRSSTTSTRSRAALIAAITDPGKSLEAIPHHDEFRERLPQPAGHRRPLQRADLRRARAGVAHRPRPRRAAGVGAWRCSAPAASPTRRSTPASRSGIAMGTLAKAGPRQADVPRRRRDRARSGRGPSSSSPRAPASTASASSRSTSSRSGRRAPTAPDRVFVRLSLAEGTDGGRDALAGQLEAAGHPVIRIELADPIDLGGEFVRWEVATAIAGAVLGIDPFDQPNVEEAKQLTRERARRRRARGACRRIRAASGPSRSTDPTPGADARRPPRPAARPNAYLALQAFIAPTPGPRRGASPGSARRCATPPAAPRPPATARASSTRPASSTRAARRPARSSS